MFDCRTGIELELLMPAGSTRLDLLQELGVARHVRVELFRFLSTVPLPTVPVTTAEEADALTALIGDIARHHDAIGVVVSPDGTSFGLAHRAGRLVDQSGDTLLSVVHDNTLAGGERVAEIVSAPFMRAGLGWFCDVVRDVARRPGVSIPPGGALHVHAEALHLKARTIARLVEVFVVHDLALRRLLDTDPAFTKAAPLPSPLLPALRAVTREEDLRACLAEHVHDRGHGLNLYNLVCADPDKPTVELKLARARLDPSWVEAVRELFVALVGLAMGDAPLPLERFADVLDALQLEPRLRAALATY